MHKSFDRAWQLHIYSPAGDTGNDSVIFLADMVHHELCFLHFYGITFSFISTPLHRRSVLRDIAQELVIMRSSFSLKLSAELFLDYPVYLKIRVPADR